ncbi:MAG: hypothetical protein PQJ59_14770 [Spirochaetales bacterium]|nr:hypothetical protein [Spirochaetales bacterium]
MKKNAFIAMLFGITAFLTAEVVPMAHLTYMSTTRKFIADGDECEYKLNQQVGLTLSCFSFENMRLGAGAPGLYGNLSLSYLGYSTLTNLDEEYYGDSSLSGYDFRLGYNSLIGGGYMFDNYRQRILLAAGINLNGIILGEDSTNYHSLVVGPGFNTTFILGDDLTDVHLSFYLGGAWNAWQIATSSDYKDTYGDDYSGGLTLFAGVGLSYGP